MTLVTIDLQNAGYETGPDDRVVFYSPANRNAQGTIISTAEVSVPLVDGKASKELAPGPVVVQILAQGVADTRPKSGYVPEEGPVPLWDVVLDWTPALVDQGILAIEGARDEALGQVAGAVSAEAESIRWWRGYLNADADITELPQGMYGVASSSTATALGLPIDGTGWLMVYWELTSGLARSVEYHTYSGSAPVVYSMRLLGETWTSWRIKSHRAPSLRSGDDLDDARTNGRYPVVSADVANTPSQRVGTVEVAESSGSVVIQTYTDLDLDVYVRRSLSSGWTPWSQLADQAHADAIEATLLAQGEAIEAIEETIDSGGTMLIVDRGTWADTDYVAGDVVDHGTGRWLAQPYSQVERTNLVINPRFLSHRANWVTGPVVSVTPNSPSLTVNVNEAVTSVTQALQPNVTRGRTTVKEGDTISVGAVVSVPSGGAAVTVMLLPAWYPTPWWDFPLVTVQPGESKRLTVNGTTIPARKTQVGLTIAIAPGTPAGATFEVSEPIMEFAPQVGSYFDGDTPDPEGDPSTTYGWGDDETNSVSTLTVGTPAGIGMPGAHPSWVRLGAQTSGGSVPTTRPLTPPATIPAPTQTSTYISDMKPDGITLLSVTGFNVRVSHDEGLSWTLICDVRDHGIPLPRGGRWLPDGEILMAARVSGGKTKLWRSSGIGTGTVTWTQVHEFTATDVGTAGGWSWHVTDPIVLVAEYGSKTGVDNARHVYMSTDMGHSFSTIFELPNVPGIHMHGVAWDPYWDRIWITWGDDQDAWEYSDDLGQTWHRARFNDQASGGFQAVGIYPLPDCILFASDGTPNGLWRISRSQGKHQGLYEPEVAFQFNETQSITHLCHAIYQRRPGDPVLFGYGAELVDGHSRILATRDGYDVCDVWEDTYTSAAGTGLRALVGPTARGNLIWEKQDSESSAAGGGRLRWTTPWPGGY